MTNTDNQSIARGWSLGGYQNQVRLAGLYLVATPIGNLGDISLRSLDTLAAVDIVLCEDTRVSKKLLSYYGIDARCEAYHDHSDAGKRADIVARIGAGVKFALISDAGMPMISDPGYKLVCDVQHAGGYVTSIPGANAPLAALQLSGMPSDAFSFIGFLPSKQSARVAHLTRWAEVPATLIAFESAARLKVSLADIQRVFGASRKVAVIREITKKFEEVRVALPQELVDYYAAEGAPKGEIVLVIEPLVQQVWAEQDVDALLLRALNNSGTKEAAMEVAKVTGMPRKVLYNRVLELSREG